MKKTTESVTIQDGVWPTMLTPFTDSGEVDYTALDQLVEWYIGRGVAGLFAVCQSSEMFHLTLDERVAIASHVVDRLDGRCGVIASGHISDRREDQLSEIFAMAETGVDAVVLVSNRLATQSEDEEAWVTALSRFLEELPTQIPLGMYECPYPYKRVLSDREFASLCESRRFRFLKDTSCDLEILQARAEGAKDSRMKLFNANAATLLRSLEMGYAGYSGVMANVHPELYVWLWNHFSAGAQNGTDSRMLAEIQEFLTIASLFELRAYPENAKYLLSLDGIAMRTQTRVHRERSLSSLFKEEARQLRSYSRSMAQTLGVELT